MLSQMVWYILPLMCCIQHTLISPENWCFPYWSASSCCYVCGGHSQLSHLKVLAYLDVRRVTAYLSYLGHNNSLTLKQLSRKVSCFLPWPAQRYLLPLPDSIFYIAVQCVVPPPQLLPMATFFLEVIMKMVDWSAASTFKKFYYNPVFSSDYCQAALGVFCPQ